MKTLDERLLRMSEKLAALSEKAETASADVKECWDLQQQAIDEKISDTKSNVAALKENIRLQEEQDRGKLAGALLKAQMTVEAKIQDRRDARDQKLFERYVDHQIDYIEDCFEAADYLIANAKLAILETLAAGVEYDAQHCDRQ